MLFSAGRQIRNRRIHGTIHTLHRGTAGTGKIGYILLLPALDAPDDEYGAKMARLLHRAQKQGLKTSIDVVSESGDRFAKLVTPALKYVMLR